VLERDVEKRMLDPCQSPLTSKREMQILAEDAFAIDLRSILQIMSIYGERGATSFRRSFRVSTDPTYLKALPLMEKREAIVPSDKYPTDIRLHAISRAMGTRRSRWARKRQVQRAVFPIAIVRAKVPTA